MRKPSLCSNEAGRLAMKRPWVAFMLILALMMAGNMSLFSRDAQQQKSGEKTSSLLVLPVVFYTPETKWAGGVGGIYAFRPEASGVRSRPSSIYFSAIYTQLKQFQLELNPELYLKNEEYILTVKSLLEEYPNKFFGIGNNVPESMEENYTSRSVSFDVSAQKKIFPGQKIYAGLKYRFENFKLTEVERGRSLANPETVGSEGGVISGLGFIISWDTRDNIFSPWRGSYWQVQTYFNQPFVGSDYSFSNIKADLRKYASLFSGHVLAVQGLMDYVSGRIPFHKLSKLGGQNIMRGYYTGRYRDKLLVALQAEYRLPVWGRLGAVGFAGLGDVADKLAHVRFGNLKYSIGAGLRFMLNKTERTQLRLDFGWGKGTSGMYFTAGEAF